MIMDAIGLGVFAAIGGIKGMDYGLGPIGVIIAYLIDEENLMWSVVGCLVASFFYGVHFHLWAK